ncbi:nucleolar protein 6 isoform X2 [Cephus cinctus]|uniref:Nucleolar protein 6 n=1 Tax=Cephus cinctus TaxID=211228 RepID=A0AAJ7W159_CEPCN|nr:nucleolar protein 6 isoform X2 [Cephus cinctus]
MKVKRHTKLDDKNDATLNTEEIDHCENVNERAIAGKRKANNDEVIPKKKEKFNKDLYAAPTVEELNQLRETENLFHSNLFRLQIEEVLSQVKVKDKYKKLFDAWFVKFKEYIESIEETEECPLTEEESLHKLEAVVPITNIPEQRKGTYCFKKPSSVSVVGSYALGTVIGPQVSVDVSVEMPSSLFQKLDYQNYRYIRKRAIYLTFIASKIREDLAKSVKFVHDGENRRPYLKLIPAGSLGKKYTIFVKITAHENSFKLGRFHPMKNGVRPSWIFNEGTQDESLIPTPKYNTLILYDLVASETNYRNSKLLREYPSIRDGIILLKIWLTQRCMTDGYDGFNGHVLTMYVLYLLHTRKLSTFMSSYQIIRNVFNSLANSDWCHDGITMCQDDGITTRILEYHKYFDCVFLDATGYHNIAANISTETFNWVKNQADIAIKCLDNAHTDSFQILFMRKIPFHQAFDNIIRFHDTVALESIVDEKSPYMDKVDFGTNKRSQAVKLLVLVLKKGLGKRVSLITVLPSNRTEWEVTEEPPKTMGFIFIGLQLNPEFCFNIVEKGPPANLPEIKITKFQYGTGEEATIRLIHVFNSLEKELTSLTDLPLTISGIQGSSAVLRYTDVFPPLATVHLPEKNLEARENCYIFRDATLNRLPKLVPCIEASIQLSSSGKWPDEIEAVRKVKTAFHIQIAECLRKNNQLKTQAGPHYVDVLKEGYVFRLTVAHQKEINLLKQQIDEDGVIKYRDNKQSIELEKKLFHLPKITGALHGLHSQEPSFGPTCCLAKRWLSSQLLDNSHIPDIVVELLVASMYLIPEPYRPAQHPQVAFLRLLETFARNNWSTDPVIVNFNNEMTRDEIVTVENIFRTSRESLPALFISTPYDHQNSIWTSKGPNQLILNRMASLARESLKIIDTQIESYTGLKWKPMFQPPLSEYDCLIHLKPSMCPRRFQAIELESDHPVIDWHTYKYHHQQKIPIVNFDPVQYFLTDLRIGYDKYALFFHDTYGGTTIGVLLRPDSLDRKDFKVSNVDCRILDDSGKLLLNVSTMIEDFYILGRGLVDSIDVQSKKVSMN